PRRRGAFGRRAVVPGCSRGKFLRTHTRPTVTTSALVLAPLRRGRVITAEGGLSSPGVGAPPPLPAWGLMLADGKKGLMAGYWWLTVLPGGGIMLMVLSANLLGDWLPVKFDPPLRHMWPVRSSTSGAWPLT